MRRQDSNTLLSSYGKKPRTQVVVNDEIFYDAENAHAHSISISKHYGADKRVKQKYDKVNFEKHLGRYNRSKTYDHYKKTYEQKLAAAKKKQNFAQVKELQTAWRAMRKHHMVINKRGLNREIQRRGLNTAEKGTSRHREREKLKENFRKGDLVTGKVALPSVFSQGNLPAMRKAVTKSMQASFDAVNHASIQLQRQPLWNFLQMQFETKFEDLAKTALRGYAETNAAKRTKVLGWVPKVAGGAATSACLMTIPFLGVPVATVAGFLASQYASAKAGTLVQETPGVLTNKMALVAGPAKKAVVATLDGFDALAKKTGVSGRMLQVYVKGLVNVARRATDNCIGNLFGKVVTNWVGAQIRYYVGVDLEPGAVAKLLGKHGGVVKPFLQGKDMKSEKLKEMIADLVALLTPEQLRAVAKKLESAVGSSMLSPAAGPQKRVRSRRGKVKQALIPQQHHKRVAGNADRKKNWDRRAQAAIKATSRSDAERLLGDHKNSRKGKKLLAKRFK